MEAMVTSVESSWDRFVKAALNSVTGFADGKIDLHDALDNLDAYPDVDEEIVQFLRDCISEAYGNPRVFSDLKSLLSRHPKIEEVRKFMEQ